MTAIVFAAVSALTIGGADFLGGLLSRRASPVTITAAAQTTDLVLLAIWVAITGPDPNSADLLLGASAGIIGSLAFAGFLDALASGPMSIVSPATAVVGAITPFVVGLLRGERPGVLGLAGCAVGLVAIVLAGAPTRTAVPLASRTLALVVASGIGFGAFVVLLDETSGASGLSPLLAARAAGVPALLALAWFRRDPLMPARGSRALAGGMGILEFVAVATLLVALRGGPLTVVTIVSSLYPISTIILARIVLGERLTRMRATGIAAALGAVILIAADRI